MSSSVLGKRSRNVLDTQDIPNNLPARKRRAQCDAPQIYEDVSPKRSKITVGCQNGSTRTNVTRGVRSRNTAQSKAESICFNTYAAVTIDTENVEPNTQYLKRDGSIQQDENAPPFIASTPRTNRIKDILGLKTPSTPKHRVRLGGLGLTPRKPCNATSIQRLQTAFGAARQLFTQSNSPTRLVGRDAERQQVERFISDAITARTGGCTYISGAPGTGKSALVHEILQDFEDHEDVDISIINCVSLRSSSQVYEKLSQDLNLTTAAVKTSHKQHLAKLFHGKSKKRSQLVLLDEIDNLLDSECDVLYSLFEWALHPSSSLILIGIANALDLTDRFLPRLKARGLKPELLPFLPYTGSQIADIITKKLRSLLPSMSTVDDNFVPLMHPAAIQLCGKKIASQSGDLRKAFSLVRRVIDQIERETAEKHQETAPVKQPLCEVSNVSALLTPPSTPSTHGRLHEAAPVVYTVETAPRASIAHVARLASSIFNNGTLSRLNALNLQQKAVLCSLVCGERRKTERNPFITPSKSTSRVPSVKDLFSKYTTLCRRGDGLLHPLKDTEFRDVVASLETLGLVHEYRGRSSSLLTPTTTPSRAGRMDDQKQLVSAVSEKEMRDSLTGAGADLLRRLLDEA